MQILISTLNVNPNVRNLKQSLLSNVTTILLVRKSVSQGAKSFGQVAVAFIIDNDVFLTISVYYYIISMCCFSLILATISYDAYCSMMDFIQGSEMWNPYEHNQDLVKWIATYYSVQKEEGKKRKDCHNKLPQNHISSRDSFTPASSFQDIEEDQSDKHVPTWDISFEELREAYKTSAIKKTFTLGYRKKSGRTCVPSTTQNNQ